jgi:hypothetical protein
MSHTSKIEVNLTDEKTIEESCKTLGSKYHFIGNGTHRLYGENKEKGVAIKIAGWAYPVVFTNTGEMKFDLYGGGDLRDIEPLKQAYSSIKVKEQLRKKGLKFTETKTQTGEIKIHVSI